MQKIGFCERYMLTTAVLNGTKELTRRLEKALERAVTEYERKWGKSFSIVSQYYDTGFDKIGISTPNELIYLSTRYKLGEVVAVAQSYKDVWDIQPALLLRVGVQVGDLMKSKAWTNKLFVTPKAMPHQIKITGIKVERLQDITDEDCLKEGVTYDARHWVNGYKIAGLRNKYLQQSHWRSPSEAFAALIDRPGVGRKGLWESNPFVVVYEFKLIK